MKNINLLTENELPPNFSYPKQFTHILKLSIWDLEPWYFLEGKILRDIMDGLGKRFPNRKLIPFARRQDNDDIACWEASSNEAVYIIHDFASPGWEERAHFSDFYSWFRQAIEELIEFDI